MATTIFDFGVVGLGVMGQNLALNIADHGFSVAAWNLETEWTERFVAAHSDGRFFGARTLEELVRSLEPPRRILMMIKAGQPVDEMIARLRPLCQPGDILIDGGNSFFADTRRREAALAESGIHFVGMGVSGGAEGARRGPSLMPGGTRQAYARLEPVWKAIAAQTDSGPCVTYVGPDGAGHFVKMVHNGIEYGDMQLIAEVYDLARRGLGMSAEELATLFDRWNRGPLESFLIELTARIFRTRDAESGRPLVELVLDAAEQKGTGRWSAEVALELGVPVPTLSAAVDARVLSAEKDERVAAARLLGRPAARFDGDRAQLVTAIEQALYASKVCSYAQGMQLIRAGSNANQWNVDLAEMARIWKGGCIIRARLLDEIYAAFRRQPGLANLLCDEKFRAEVGRCEAGWRQAVATAATLGVPVPAMSASLAYYDSYRSAELPQNLTQAQRDAFGAHTYVRADQPARGHVHSDWS